MADHMTAEQLRTLINQSRSFLAAFTVFDPATDSIDRRNLAASLDVLELAIDALDQLAARLSGMAAVPDFREFIMGMSVSVDVSTCEDDAGHRYFGTVTDVMDDPDDKHGVTLLVQDAEPNFTPAAPEPPHV